MAIERTCPLALQHVCYSAVAAAAEPLNMSSRPTTNTSYRRRLHTDHRRQQTDQRLCTYVDSYQSSATTNLSTSPSRCASSSSSSVYLPKNKTHNRNTNTIVPCTLPRISSSARPDSSKTSALYKSCTYFSLLTYLQIQMVTSTQAEPGSHQIFSCFSVPTYHSVRTL